MKFLQGEVYAGSEAEIVDFEELSEKAEEVEQADLEAKQAEFRENNPDVVARFPGKDGRTVSQSGRTECGR